MNTPRKIWMVENDNHDAELYWNFEDAERSFLEDTTSLTDFLSAVRNKDTSMLDEYLIRFTEYAEAPNDFYVSIDDGPRIRQVEVR